VVGEADLSGHRIVSAPDKTRVGDGVMGAAEGACGHQPVLGPDQSGDGIDFGGLDGLLQVPFREDRRQPLGEHGLAGPRRADQQNIMGAGGRDFHGPLRGLLAADILKIVRGGIPLPPVRRGIETHGFDGLSSGEILDDLRQAGDGDGIDTLDEGALGGVLPGKDDALQSGGPGGE